MMALPALHGNWDGAKTATRRKSPVPAAAFATVKYPLTVGQRATERAILRLLQFTICCKRCRGPLVARCGTRPRG
jgi:hypothetical protein